MKIRSKFTGEYPCQSVIFNSHFGMGVSLEICCIFSEHIFLRTPLEGCFCWFNAPTTQMPKIPILFVGAWVLFNKYIYTASTLKFVATSKVLYMLMDDAPVLRYLFKTLMTLLWNKLFLFWVALFWRKNLLASLC